MSDGRWPGSEAAGFTAGAVVGVLASVAALLGVEPAVVIAGIIVTLAGLAWFWIEWRSR